MDEVEKKGQLTEMFERVFKNGVLFPNLPQILIVESGWFKSESDYLLQVSRHFKQDFSLGADDSFFRKLRDGSLEPEDMQKFFGTDLRDNISIDEGCIPGGWLFLQCFIPGLKIHISEAEELMLYVEFIEALCEEEHALLKTIEVTELNDLPDLFSTPLSKWLLIDDRFDANNQAFQLKFVVAFTLLWAALYENFYFIDYKEYLSENNVSSQLNYLLPELDSKGKFKTSSEVFIRKVKDLYAKELGENITKWKMSDFLRVITKKIDSSADEIDPDFEKVKKALRRIGKGDSPLTVKRYSKYIGILGLTDTDTINDSSVLMILFIQIFTVTQNNLIEQGYAPEDVVSEFTRYMEYFNMVGERFMNFKKEGSTS